MAKHVIEEELLHGSGFNVVTHREVEITADNAERILKFITDGTIDIDVINHNIKFSSRVPVFTTLDW